MCWMIFSFVKIGAMKSVRQFGAVNEFVSFSLRDLHVMLPRMCISVKIVARKAYFWGRQ
jgi:hypothetical protein